MALHGVSRAQLEVAGVVSFYMVAALVMVFVNKAVLISTPSLPLGFLTMQLAIAVVLLHVAAKLAPGKVQLPAIWGEWTRAKKLAPVILVNAVGLVFNTLCLRGVDAAFFQIARGLVLPLTITVSAVHMRDLPKPKLLAAAAAVTFGFLLGVAPSSVSVEPVSLIYGFLSSLFIALHAVLIKTSLPHCNNSALELAYWSNGGGVLILVPLALLMGEGSTAAALVGDQRWNWAVFVSGTLITGVFGFLLCVAGLLSVKVTSPVTHMFSSAAKSVLQTLLGVWFFNDVMTVNRGASIMVITAGTLYYTWVKSTGNAPPSEPSKQQQQQRVEFNADDEDSDLEAGEGHTLMSQNTLGLSEKLDREKH